MLLAGLLGRAGHPGLGLGLSSDDTLALISNSNSNRDGNGDGVSAGVDISAGKSGSKGRADIVRVHRRDVAVVSVGVDRSVGAAGRIGVQRREVALSAEVSAHRGPSRSLHTDTLNSSCGHNSVALRVGVSVFVPRALLGPRVVAGVAVDGRSRRRHEHGRGSDNRRRRRLNTDSSSGLGLSLGVRLSLGSSGLSSSNDSSGLSLSVSLSGGDSGSGISLSLDSSGLGFSGGSSLSLSLGLRSSSLSLRSSNLGLSRSLSLGRSGKSSLSSSGNVSGRVNSSGVGGSSVASSKRRLNRRVTLTHIDSIVTVRSVRALGVSDNDVVVTVRVDETARHAPVHELAVLVLVNLTVVVDAVVGVVAVVLLGSKVCVDSVVTGFVVVVAIALRERSNNSGVNRGVAAHSRVIHRSVVVNNIHIVVVIVAAMNVALIIVQVWDDRHVDKTGHRHVHLLTARGQLILLSAQHHLALALQEVLGAELGRLAARVAAVAVEALAPAVLQALQNAALAGGRGLLLGEPRLELDVMDLHQQRGIVNRLNAVLDGRRDLLQRRRHAQHALSVQDEHVLRSARAARRVNGAVGAALAGGSGAKHGVAARVVGHNGFLVDALLRLDHGLGNVETVRDARQLRRSAHALGGLAVDVAGLQHMHLALQQQSSLLRLPILELGQLVGGGDALRSANLVH